MTLKQTRSQRMVNLQSRFKKKKVRVWWTEASRVCKISSIVQGRASMPLKKLYRMRLMLLRWALWSCTRALRLIWA